MSRITSLDIGGTFTDCISVDENGTISTCKRPSTPTDFSKGFMDALGGQAEVLGLNVNQLSRQTSQLLHGTTVATNAMTQGKGCKAGLIVTAGTREVIYHAKGISSTFGISLEDMLDLTKMQRAPQIIPVDLIEEVNERLDYEGCEVVKLDRKGVKQAVRKLLDRGVEAIGIAFLWSFKNPEHELAAKAIVKQISPDLFVTTSSELIPKLGDYERFSATAINAYIGPVTAAYLISLATKVKEVGYESPLLIMQCNGGVVPAEDACTYPVKLIGSGPTGGVIGSAYLGNVAGHKDIITTDMGGTTLDVGMVVDGAPVLSASTIVNQYDYFMPSISVESIGAGSGSIIWHDPVTKTIKVGPLSAGAEPGPVAYQKGGTEPTVFDANLVLGYINPDYFLGGRLKIDKKAAQDSLEKLGKVFGLSAVEVASGAVRIVDSHMADLIRKVSIQKGYDPREFVIYAFGGAGPMHCVGYSKEVGCKQVVVPLGNLCSFWSAYGMAAADIVHVIERDDIMFFPYPTDKINADFEELEEKSRQILRREGLRDEDIKLERSVDMRYTLQIHEVEVPINAGKLTSNDLKALDVRFDELYDRLFGKGTGYKMAGREIRTIRVKAIGNIPKPPIVAAAKLETNLAKDALKGKREVWQTEERRFALSPIYDGSALKPGNVVEGCAVIEMPATTIVVPRGHAATVDQYGNYVISL